MIMALIMMMTIMDRRRLEREMGEDPNPSAGGKPISVIISKFWAAAELVGIRYAPFFAIFFSPKAAVFFFLSELKQHTYTRNICVHIFWRRRRLVVLGLNCVALLNGS
jgi:hypothetical protein